jgi:hypothetical protein
MERRSAPIMILSLAFSMSSMSTSACWARREQRRLVDQVGEVGTGEARRAARDHRGVDVVGGRHLAHVHLEDLLATADVRQRHHDLAVEAPGRSSAGSSTSGTVGRGDHDDALVALEAVHLDQQLVEGLLALVVAAAEAGATMAADGVDLVDEDDAGRCFLACSNMSRTREAPTPTNISTKSEPEMVKNGTLASPAMAARAGSCRCRAGRPSARPRDLAAELLELGRVAQEVDQLLTSSLASSRRPRRRR